MASLCEDVLHELNMLWKNTSLENQPKCLNNVILEISPSVFFALIILPYMIYLWTRSRELQPVCFIFVGKIFLIVVLCMFSIASNIYTGLENKQGQIENVVQCVDTVCKVLYIVTICFERSCNIIRSFPLFAYWLLTSLCLCIKLAAIGMVQVDSMYYFILTSTSLRLFISLCLLILTCLSEYHGNEKKEHNQEFSASVISWMTFSWLNKIVFHGFKKELQTNYIFDLNEEESADFVSKRVQINYYKMKKGHKCIWSLSKWVLNPHKTGEKINLLNQTGRKYTNVCSKSLINQEKKVKRTFLCTLLFSFGWDFIFSNIGIIMCTLSYLLTPFILGLLIDFVQNLNEPKWHGYVYMLAFIAIKILNTSFQYSTEFLSAKLAVRVTSATMSAIFQKCLKLSSQSKRSLSDGEIINLMFLDTNHLELFIKNAYWLWMSFPILIVSGYLLFSIIGLPMFSGLAVILLIFCLKTILTYKQKIIIEKIMCLKDQRLKIISEALTNIKFIKLNGWEQFFINKILAARNKELKELCKYVFILSIYTFFYTAATFWIYFFIFTTYLMVNETHIDSKKIFLTITFVQLIQMIIVNLPLSLGYTVKMATSLSRINHLFQLENLETSTLKRNLGDDLAIQIESGFFSWEKTGNLCLKNINVKVKPGQLVAVIGPVASGKSSLLFAIMGEMRVHTGILRINSSLAYMPQQPWILNTTLRENITFGKAFDESFYQKVIDSCALQDDIKNLPAGDLTEIGEKGTNLSGGQKQRVSLARAVYSKADIYLLDDPLSAVDAKVAQHIFHSVIGSAGLLKNKTRIWTTHGLKWLSDVDFMIVMNDGRIQETGTFQELVNQEGDFYDIISKISEKIEPQHSLAKKGKSKIVGQIQNYKETTLSCTMKSLNLIGPFNNAMQMRNLPELQESKIMTNETMKTGKVRWKTYLEFGKSFGLICGIITAFFTIGFHVFFNVTFLWLISWNEDEQLYNNSTRIESILERIELNQYYLIGYFILGLLQTLCSVVYGISLNYGHMTSSRLLHAQLVNSIFKAPITFFDTTPMGRILLKFNQDTSILDNEFFLEMEVYIEHVMFAIGIVAIISYSIPATIAISLPIVILIYILQQLCMKTLCQLRRLALQNMSPVMSFCIEVLSGLTVIRAYVQQKRFIQELLIKLDNFQKPAMLASAAKMWIKTRLDILTYIILVAITLFTIEYRNNTQPGLLILSLTYILMLTNEIRVATEMASELEINTVSIERILDYSQIDSEGPWTHSEDKYALDSWPSHGSIELVNYSTRYRKNLDFVLQDVSFSIKPGEKIGIIGRTGSGKSSLVQSLFRLLDAVHGKILIDGIDISKMGLHTLRQRLTILPQEPVLFSGTLRHNLDSLNQNTEDELWESLELVQLKSFFQSLPNKLDYEIGEGGCNLSMGQRQLVCLARTLLKKTKILILDEATASVDLKTDEIIQKTIRKSFPNSTVLTIAHRVNTLLDYDRIMILQNGRVIEFDSPKNLLSDNKSVLHTMTNESI